MQMLGCQMLGHTLSVVVVRHRCLSRANSARPTLDRHFISSFGPAICTLASLLGAQCAQVQYLSVNHSSIP